MAQQPVPTVENHFIAGLKTEFTGLNFPDNAATDTQNCVYSLIGDVTRRGGINYEQNFVLQPIYNQSVARSNYRWLNAGGDGQSQILVNQAGKFLFFFLSSNATPSNPLSQQILSQNIDLDNYVAQGNTNDITKVECQYTSGNGYLFVFHPNCDPFYVTYNVSSNSVSATKISIKTRDLTGIFEPGVSDNYRPTILSNEHFYNLLNQGWTTGSGWSGTSTLNTGGIPLSNVNPSGALSLTLTSQSTGTVVSGDELSLNLSLCAGTGSNPHNNGTVILTATVTSFSYPNVNLVVTSNSNPALNATGLWAGGNFSGGPSPVDITLVNEGFINTWFTAFNNYPSNSDVWWLYKNTSDAFAPATTGPNVQPTTTPAPKGSFILNPFIQDRSSASSIGVLTVVSTAARPLTGAFYQGRVFYAGVNSSFPAQGDEQFYTWTENIYFSQIIESPQGFGNCYQQNDPTSQNLFDILPSDGGQIVIPGCGAIYKLFPLRFGLLVFAANGIWFIGGSTGVGFSASDYTVTKISSIRAISGSSFIDVQGYPMFWNQEGIYHVTPSAQGGSAHSPDIQLTVQNLTLGTILTYYQNIPITSKYYSRGDYDELNYVVQWCYRTTVESGINNRYQFDTILAFNTVTQAFYPYTLPMKIGSGTGPTGFVPTISDIKYIISPGGINSSPPVFKYITGLSNTVGDYLTFSEENDFTNYTDFISEPSISPHGGVEYTSYFVAGYKLPGQALRKMQMPYVYLFSRNSDRSQCFIQAIWDFAGGTSGGKESTKQNVTMRLGNLYRKVKLRGRGLAVQLKITSVAGQPLDLMGWSVLSEVNPGI